MADFTEFRVTYELDDSDAKSDATVTESQAAPISNTDLFLEKQIYPTILSNEHNYSILDGSHSEYSDTTEIAFQSLEKSNSAGTFTTNPSLDISFSEYHTSYALTLYFTDTPPLEANVTWYHDTVMLYGMTVELGKTKSVINYPVDSYNRIVITFTKTVPDRYIRLNYINYGATIDWDETYIKNGTLTKSMNRVGDMLAIDTLTFTIVDKDHILNLGNPNGVYKLFQRNQAMYPVETLDDTDLPLGKFYMQEFKHDDASGTGNITAVSYMGLLDTIQYYQGDVYNGTPAYVALESIFRVAGVTNYEIDSITRNQPLYGALPPCTCREALSAVLFACQSCVDTSDVDGIKISKYSNRVFPNIRRSNKISTAVSLAEYVSGVKINYAVYTETAVGTLEEISTETYPAGTNLVTFDTPHDDVFYVLSSGNIISAGKFFVEFELDSQSTVTIMGKPYSIVSQSIVQNRPKIKKGECENIKEYDTTLCNHEMTRDVLDSILEYYDNNFVLNIQHFANEIELNNVRQVQNPIVGLDNYVAMFTERTFDLTGGFVDSATMLGKFDLSDRYLYCTNTNVGEYYAGDDVGII